MAKQVSRRPEPIPQQPPAAAAPPLPRAAEGPPEPSAPVAPPSWGWRATCTLWAAAFGFLAAYELFKMVQCIVR
jgi:hypothetical protein